MTLVSEEQGLAEAIEGLYGAFSAYPLAQAVVGCPCCVSAEDEAQIRGRPLRALTAEDLGRYAFKAMTTWGDGNDFKHFLPRLLELVTDADSIVGEVDVEVLFGKLRYGKWQAWPEQEREAVSRYFTALWRFLLTCSPEAATLDGYLCGIGQVEDDLAPYLDVWKNMKTGAALDELVTFVNSQESLHKHRLTNAFWFNRQKQMSQVVDWLFRSGLAQ